MLYVPRRQSDVSAALPQPSLYPAYTLPPRAHHFITHLIHTHFVYSSFARPRQLTQVTLYIGQPAFRNPSTSCLFGLVLLSLILCLPRLFSPSRRLSFFDDLRLSIFKHTASASPRTPLPLSDSSSLLSVCTSQQH